MQRHGVDCGASPHFQIGQDSDGDFEMHPTHLYFMFLLLPLQYLTCGQDVSVALSA